MQAKPEEREAARRLRAQGLSLGRVARELGVAKSSVSV
jgi:predicted transcriptional regulator